MSQSEREARQHLGRIYRDTTTEELAQRLAPKPGGKPKKIPGASIADAAAVERRWSILKAPAGTREILWDAGTAGISETFAHNIENLIGAVKLPVGVAGPLRVNGLAAKGDYYVPLATTEAALVASYTRGALALTEAGGCTAAVVAEGLSRAPGFVFENFVEAGRFVSWLMQQIPRFPAIAEATTRHGKLVDTRLHVAGNHVYLQLEFLTGDAAGQNMVTIATEAVCGMIRKESPVPIKHAFVEANLSGDKKASALSFLTVRGKKVIAEALLPAEVVEKRFHTTVEKMEVYWRMSAMGGVMSGTIGVQGHYANGLAALYIATGQDAACVAESSVGVTRFERTENGSLYATVTLPNLVVGTVGGGTKLPSQAACLDLLGLRGAGHAQALAEVAGALCLAGELSIIGALSAGDFSRAHRKLARGTIDPMRSSS